MSEDEVAHKRVNEVRPEWAVGDWHCSCGAWGNLGWQGFAFHLSGDVIPALSGVPEGAARVRHGRHCPCSACARQDWTLDYLAPCDYHGVQCAYSPAAPQPVPEDGP